MVHQSYCWVSLSWNLSNLFDYLKFSYFDLSYCEVLDYMWIWISLRIKQYLFEPPVKKGFTFSMNMLMDLIFVFGSINNMLFLELKLLNYQLLLYGVHCKSVMDKILSILSIYSYTSTLVDVSRQEP